MQTAQSVPVSGIACELESEQRTAAPALGCRARHVGRHRLAAGCILVTQARTVGGQDCVVGPSGAKPSDCVAQGPLPRKLQCRAEQILARETIKAEP